MVGNDALTQRLHSNDVTGGTAQHAAGSCTDLQNLAGILIDRNNRGFTNHKALAVCINQHIGCTQVDTQVIGRKIEHIVTYWYS